MSESSREKTFFQKFLTLLLGFGPGIFAIGYTIGTGSVTSMIVAGSSFGMQLLWVLLLSCVFSGVLIHAYGHFALLTGQTALFAFKQHIKGGKIIAIFIIIGVSLGQWSSLMGILGISSNVIFEILNIYFPQIAGYEYEVVLGIAILIIGVMYRLLLVGKYSFFEKVLIIFVTIMGMSFLISLLFVFPLPLDIAQGLLPSIPEVEGGKMLVAAFVGTTMAAATFLSRPLFVRGKGWTKNNIDQQKKDAIVAATLVFIISAAIMAVACGALFYEGQKVTKVIDMAGTLEPVAGRFAITLFFFGTLSAGLSSIFPCMLIAPLLIADYQSGELDTNSKQFKWITGIAAIVALTVPLVGGNPIQVQILTQVFNVFILPLVIIGILLMINNKKVMKDYRPSLFLNLSLIAALFFACVISFNGMQAILDM